MAKRTLLIGCTSDAVLSTGRTPGGRVISCCRLLWCESLVALPSMPVMPMHWSHVTPPSRHPNWQILAAIDVVFLIWFIFNTDKVTATTQRTRV